MFFQFIWAFFVVYVGFKSMMMMMMMMVTILVIMPTLACTGYCWGIARQCRVHHLSALMCVRTCTCTLAHSCAHACVGMLTRMLTNAFAPIARSMCLQIVLMTCSEAVPTECAHDLQSVLMT